MKNKTFSLLFVVLTSSSIAVAQDYAFKVLANKGTNEVKSGDSWTPLKTGASLQKTDEIRLADNAYIGLVHKDGKPVELKKAGNYQVSKLEEGVGKGSSVLNKYTDFILSSNSPESKKNKLNATGAVHRAAGDAAASIHLALPENQYSGIYNTLAVINWDGSKVAGPYVVTIKNLFEEDIAKIETPETSVKLDLADSKFATLEAVLVVVSSKTDASLVSNQRLIKKLDKAKQENIKTLLNEFLGDVQEPTALNKRLLAGFYEQQGLLIDAIGAYEESVALAPDVPDFIDAYNEFLLRHALRQ
jgi:hypothetical protein